MIPELLPGDSLHLLYILFDLRHDLRIDLPPVFIVLRAGLRRDRKALRDGEPDIGHLREVCPLAPEELSHVGISFREQVNPFSSHRLAS